MSNNSDASAHGGGDTALGEGSQSNSSSLPVPSSSSSSFPSYEERHEQELLNGPEGQTKLNPDARRIRWTLNGPLETSITIVQLGRVFDADEVPEPYFLGNNDDDEGNPTWHPFSRSPLTEPKVSSLKLFVDPLDEWDRFWMEEHEDHTEPDATYDPAEVLYGPFPDPDQDAGERRLLRCCGEERPLGKGTHLVIRGTAGDGGFVTVHDFLSVVHPYLMSRRDEVLEAMALDRGRPGRRPFGSETKLIVTWMNPSAVDVQTEAEWMRSNKKRGTVTSIVPVSGPRQEGQAQTRVSLFEAALAQAAARAAAERNAPTGPPDSTPGGA